MADTVAKLPFSRQIDQLLCLLYRDGKGLLAENMLSGQQRVLCYLVMRNIGGTDVYRIDRRILEYLAIVIHCRFYAKSGPELFCARKFTAGNRSYLDELHSPERFQMNAPHKSGSDDCRSKPFH